MSGPDRRDPGRRRARACDRRHRRSLTSCAGGRCWPGRWGRAARRRGPGPRGRRRRPLRRRAPRRAEGGPAAPPLGTADAVAAAAAAFERAARWSSSPATSRCRAPRCCASWRSAHARAARRRRWSPPCSTIQRLRPRRPRRRGAFVRVVETKTRGRRERGRARDPRGQHRHLRVRRRGAAGRAPAVGGRNAQGELLPARTCSPLLAPTAQRSRRTPSTIRTIVLGVNDRVALAAVAARAAPHPRAPHARRRDDRATRRQRHRRRRGIGADTVIEPCTAAARRHRRGRRPPSSGRTAR